MTMKVLRLVGVCLLPLASSVTMEQGVGAGKNPVRKVVTLLQKMQAKVKAESEKADELYEKFMCYCRSSGGALQKSLDDAKDRIPELEAGIKAGNGKLSQLKDDVKEHKTDKATAEKKIAEATAIREKEKAAFDKALTENKVNLESGQKALTAIEQGMGGSFLQTESAGKLRSLLDNNPSIITDSNDHDELVAFLSGGQGNDYAPASGQILGILKQMVDEMVNSQKEMRAAEADAVKNFEALIAATKKELGVLQKNIESKMQRTADLSVKLAEMKNDLEDTQDGFAEDSKFAADLKKSCATKGDVHAEEQKLRQGELAALADTIKILNDDDALDLFKKTLPSASSSFLQVQESMSSLRARARSALSHHGKHRRLDFVLLALRGKKVGLDKIIKLIDELVGTLKKEQAEDEEKKEYCEEQFDLLDDEKKSLERSIKDENTVIVEAKDAIKTLGEEIEELKASIGSLDKTVADATEQRKEEAAEYKELMSSNNAAKELLLMAKNRLNKFYNPKLAKGAAASFVQLSLDVSLSGAPPPPPETAAAYSKKSEESGGVIAMINLLISDLEKEINTATAEEKGAKAEYEETIKDAAEKRSQDSKSLADKETAIADLKNAEEESAAKVKSASKDLSSTVKAIADLHAECDWLLKYFKIRQQARNDELESLESAKSVLSGADFSLLQRGSTRTVRRHD